MNRLMGGVIAAALVAVACSAGAVTGTPTTNPQVSAAIGSAQTQLCVAGAQDSLQSLAAQLANIDPNADTTPLQTNLGKAASNLNSLTVSAAQQPLKDAAVTAIQQVQAGLSNPQTVQQVATTSSSALTALATAICK
jgi:hypothetical protein